ncbi:MAG: hypothetical protein ACOYT4_05390 [Nanoarchaeota archaeon]
MENSNEIILPKQFVREYQDFIKGHIARMRSNGEIISNQCHPFAYSKLVKASPYDLITIWHHSDINLQNVPKKDKHAGYLESAEWDLALDSSSRPGLKLSFSLDNKTNVSWKFSNLFQIVDFLSTINLKNPAFKEIEFSRQVEDIPFKVYIGKHNNSFGGYGCIVGLSYSQRLAEFSLELNSNLESVFPNYK